MEQKSMKKPKNKKLLVEMGIISLLIFTATFIYSVFTDYTVTKNAFLSSKIEMMDRDLKNVNNYINTAVPLGEFWDSVKEYGDDILRPYTEEELERRTSREVKDKLFDYYLGTDMDWETIDPDVRFFLVKDFFMTLTMLSDSNVRDMKYADITLLDFTEDDKAYIYIRNNADEIEYFSEGSFLDDYTAVSYAEALKTVPYPVSEHIAVKKILRGDVSEAGNTVYEIYHDPDTDKDYYLGYTPVVKDGKVVCYACVKYDWSDFRSDIINEVRNSNINGFVVLVLLYGLLILLMYLKAIRPLLKVKTGVQEYMNDKDSEAVIKKMDEITVRNEVGVLADSFSALADEINRYTEENLRLGAEKERIETELTLATKIQMDALPPVAPEFADHLEVNLRASMNTAKEVGGDFYDYFTIDDHRICFLIADVSGKGTPAALFMMTAKTMIKDYAMTHGSTSEIFTDVNDRLCENNEAGMFATAWIGILDTRTMIMQYTNAGHNYPMIRQAGKSFEMIRKRHGLFLAGMEGIKYKQSELQLSPGDRILLYTDGVTEAHNIQNALYGEDRLVEVLNATEDESGDMVLTKVLSDVGKFSEGAPQFDDITMMVVTIKK